LILEEEEEGEVISKGGLRKVRLSFKLRVDKVKFARRIAYSGKPCLDAAWLA
jgi:hypothetical protein